VKDMPVIPANSHLKMQLFDDLIGLEKGNIAALQNSLLNILAWTKKLRYRIIKWGPFC